MVTFRFWNKDLWNCFLGQRFCFIWIYFILTNMLPINSLSARISANTSSAISNTWQRHTWHVWPIYHDTDLSAPYFCLFTHTSKLVQREDILALFTTWTNYASSKTSIEISTTSLRLSGPREHVRTVTYIVVSYRSLWEVSHDLLLKSSSTLVTQTNRKIELQLRSLVRCLKLRKLSFYL